MACEGAKDLNAQMALFTIFSLASNIFIVSIFVSIVMALQVLAV